MAFVRHEGHLLFQLTYATKVKDMYAILKYRDNVLIHKSQLIYITLVQQVVIAKYWRYGSQEVLK